MNWFRALGWYSSGKATIQGASTPQKKLKEWERPFSIQLYLTTMLQNAYRMAPQCVCVWVCVRERERARARESNHVCTQGQEVLHT